jgi:hypothetical protein
MPLIEEGMTRSREGLEHSKLGRRKQAAGSFRRAIETLGTVTDEFPATAEYR